MSRDPELMIPPSVLKFERFGNRELLRRVCSEIDDAILKEIANGDYGHDYTNHLAALRRFRAGKDWDTKLHWVPLEVLSLFRWSEYEEGTTKLSERDFFLGRLFCAACLCHVRDVHEDEDEESGRNSPDILGPMLVSCLGLGGEYMAMMRGEIVTVLDGTNPWDEPAMFWVFGLLAACELDPGFEDGGIVREVGDWLVDLSEQSLEWHSAKSPDAVVFLELQYATILTDLWRGLADKILLGENLTDRAREYLVQVSECEVKSPDLRNIYKDLTFRQRLSIFAMMTRGVWAVFFGKRDP